MPDTTMTMRDVRANLGQRVDAAHYTNQATVITKNGQPRAVLVSYRTMLESVISKLQEIADQYPADVFTNQGKTSDGIAGTAIRERMLAEIRHLQSEAEEAR